MGRAPRGSVNGRSTAATRAAGGSRVHIIQAVNTPLGFFVLVVLLVEAFLGSMAIFTPSERMVYVYTMAVLIVLLIGIVALLAWFRPEALMGTHGERSTPLQPVLGILKIYERSNDFLATGDRYQFPSLLKQAKREVWLIGTSFYISLDQYNDLLLAKLADGIDLNFLITSPNKDSADRVAKLMNVGEKEVSHDCMSGIRILERTLAEARRANSPGSLRIKITNEPIQTRLYLFDPRADDGYLYYVPQLNGTNPQTIPGFLVANAKAPYHSAYFKAALKMWHDAGSVSFEAWKSTHPDFQ